MATKRCKNGHYYDDSKYQGCPYCGLAGMDSSKTVPLVGNQMGSSAVTVPLSGSSDACVTVPLTGAYDADSGKTVGFMEKSHGIDPVVGWLVCIEGAEKGQDYKIKAEKNFVGRDKSNDIVLAKDNSVSREKHAVISHNPKNDMFVIMPGEGRGLIYLNGNEVLVPTELHSGDRIEMGETVLMFIPFCGEAFRW